MFWTGGWDGYIYMGKFLFWLGGFPGLERLRGGAGGILLGFARSESWG